jgi:hypothetical protein
MENINEESSYRKDRRNNPLPHRHRMGNGCDATNPEAVTKIFKLKKSRNQT